MLYSADLEDTTMGVDKAHEVLNEVTTFVPFTSKFLLQEFLNFTTRLRGQGLKASLAQCPSTQNLCRRKGRSVGVQQGEPRGKKGLEFRCLVAQVIGRRWDAQCQ